MDNKNNLNYEIGESLKAFNQTHYKNNRMQQIRGFCNLVTFKSVTEAARVMGLSQPAISIQIKTLERDLGKILVKKEGKFLVPTEEGLKFYEYVMPTLHKLDNIYDEYLVHTNEEEDKTLRIGAYYNAITRFLPKACKVMQANYPDVKISIKHCFRDDGIRDLREGKLDVIIFNRVDIPEDLTLLKVLTFKPVIMASIRNPIAKLERRLEVEDLKNQNFLLIENFKVMSAYSEMFKKLNLSGKIEFINLDWEAMRFFVKENLGISFFGEFFETIGTENGVKEIDVSHLFPIIKYGIITKKTGKIKPALQLYLDTIEEAHIGY